MPTQINFTYDSLSSIDAAIKEMQANKKKTMPVRRHTLRPRETTSAARSFTGSTRHIRNSSQINAVFLPSVWRRLVWRLLE